MHIETHQIESEKKAVGISTKVIDFFSEQVKHLQSNKSISTRHAGI